MAQTGTERSKARDRATPPQPAASLEQPEAPKLPAWAGVNGFVDIHCHLAAGLDDGPKTEAESLSMAWAAYQAGTKAVVATPHSGLRHRFDPDALAQSLERIEDRLSAELFLFSGCELELSDEPFAAFLADPRRYTIGGGRYLLVELPRGAAPPHAEAALEKVRELGLVPILAHPERYAPERLPPRRLGDWIRNGCLTQITASALAAPSRGRVRGAAFELLQAGLVDFVASDGHDAHRRPPTLWEGFQAAAETVGVGRAGRLFTHNPLAVLNDEPIETIRC